MGSRGSRTAAAATCSVVCDECGKRYESVGEWVENDPCVTEGPRACPKCGRYDCVFDGIERAISERERDAGN